MKTGHNVKVNGTCLQGYITASFDELVLVFGEPIFFESGDKTDVEWHIEFPDGTVANIYNWKDYDGGQRCRTQEDYHWHIGGHNQRAVELVERTTGIHTTNYEN